MDVWFSLLRSLKDGDYVQLVHLFPLEEVQIHLTGLELHGVEVTRK